MYLLTFFLLTVALVMQLNWIEEQLMPHILKKPDKPYSDFHNNSLDVRFHGLKKAMDLTRATVQSYFFIVPR